MKTSATIEGFDNLLKAMNELSEEITKGKTARIWGNALRYAMIPVKETAQQIVTARAYDSGQLANSLYIKVHKPQARDKQSLSYQGEMYMARVSVKSARAESEIKSTTYTTKKGKVITRQYVGFHGSNRPVSMAINFGTKTELGDVHTPAQPFLRPALEANILKVQQRLGQALWNELTFGKYAKEAGLDFTGRI